MPRCYKDCKHNNWGYCLKYDDKILESKNFCHFGLPIHPLQYLTLYYNENEDKVDTLIKIAKKYLSEDEVVDSICSYFARYGQISFKQRKLLLYKIFDCFEVREKVQNDIVFCQVE